MSWWNPSQISMAEHKQFSAFPLTCPSGVGRPPHSVWASATPATLEKEEKCPGPHTGEWCAPKRTPSMFSLILFAQIHHTVPAPQPLRPKKGQSLWLKKWSEWFPNKIHNCHRNAIMTQCLLEPCPRYKELPGFRSELFLVQKGGSLLSFFFWGRFFSMISLSVCILFITYS